MARAFDELRRRAPCGVGMSQGLHDSAGMSRAIERKYCEDKKLENDDARKQAKQTVFATSCRSAVIPFPEQPSNALAMPQKIHPLKTRKTRSFMPLAPAGGAIV